MVPKADVTEDMSPNLPGSSPTSGHVTHMYKATSLDSDTRTGELYYLETCRPMRGYIYPSSLTPICSVLVL